MFYNKFPYTDLQQKNLDWMIQTIKDGETAVENKIAEADTAIENAETATTAANNAKTGADNAAASANAAAIAATNAKDAANTAAAHAEETAVKYGTPYATTTAASMTDHTKIYVYTGTEVGYTAGNWYYWDGDSWESGGVYVGDISDAVLFNTVQSKSNAEKETADRNIGFQKAFLNRFDKNNVQNNKYVNPSNGVVSTAEGFFASDYIYIGDLTAVKCSQTHLFSFYDSSKTFIESPADMDTIGTTDTYTLPAGAAYLRFSTYTTYLNSAQIGENIVYGSYVPYGKYILHDLVLEDGQLPDQQITITVAKNGGGDYTSLTLAMKENTDVKAKVIVYPGTYDIMDEYEDIWGSSAVDNMADSDSATFGGFQYGVTIKNKEIEFLPGSYVVCDRTGKTVDGTHRFSAFAVYYNVKITGLNLVATHLFYGIHDDYGINSPYTVEYDNCYIKAVNCVNANTIGGGCKKYSRHILNNCYLDSSGASPTFRYHNTNDPASVPEVYVSNCYTSNAIWFTWYGEQTTKMKVYVNNCDATEIIKRQESISYDTDNIDLFKWNNNERSL